MGRASDSPGPVGTFDRQFGVERKEIEEPPALDTRRA
jgi:hypothetical protein